jgi:hypothetical protein
MGVSKPNRFRKNIGTCNGAVRVPVPHATCQCKSSLALPKTLPLTQTMALNPSVIRMRYMVSLEPLNPFLSRFILDVSLFRWEVVTGRKERGSFDLLSTTLPSNQFLGLRALNSFYPGSYLFNVAIGKALASGQQRSR